jgi:hypothetical protein
LLVGRTRFRHKNRFGIPADGHKRDEFYEIADDRCLDSLRHATDQSSMTWRVILLGIAFLVWPATYAWLCDMMSTSRIQRPPVVPFFFLFGTLGGWVFAAALSPSGLTAASIVFLMVAAPLALVISSVYLMCRSERSIYHRLAIWSGFGYVGLLLAFFVVALVVTAAQGK